MAKHKERLAQIKENAATKDRMKEQGRKRSAKHRAQQNAKKPKLHNSLTGTSDQSSTQNANNQHSRSTSGQDVPNPDLSIPPVCNDIDMVKTVELAVKTLSRTALDECDEHTGEKNMPRLCVSSAIASLLAWNQSPECQRKLF